MPIEDLADQLAACGVAALFGVPGSGASLKLITTLERRGVPFYGTCHEAAAATMAGAFGRIGRSQGCCVSIKGPGLANMVPGILSNAYENLPVISLAEAYPAGPRSRAHKALDHATVLASCAKVYSGLEGADTISRLTAIARDEIPGPVHIDLAPQSGVVRVSSHWTRRPAAPAGALEAIGKARRPIVIAGGLATRRPWGNTLTSLRIPVFTTVAAKGLIDEHGSFAAGIFTGDGKDETPEARLIPEADLVVGLGLRNLEVLTPQTFGVPSVLVDAVGDGWGFSGARSFAAATDDDFAAVIELLRQREWGADLVVQAKNHVIDMLTAHEWMPGKAMTTLRAALPAQTRVVVDTGSFCIVAEHVWEVADASRFIASANGRFMGTSVPMAIGTALADRSCPVVCLAGDGGLPSVHRRNETGARPETAAAVRPRQ